ncbi:MAG TPA: hypothetical protein VEB42_15820, partial [Chitinophagaceae bacterium]|nr:hypothetical protein [Chitinophagaceae bacterium]
MSRTLSLTVQVLLLCIALNPAHLFAGQVQHLIHRDTVPGSPKPFFQFNGGVVNYNFFYRANIDTPYAQKNVTQHTATGNIHFTLAGKLPVTVTYLARNSNSAFFRDIYDVRADFDAASFRNKLNAGYKQRLMEQLDAYKDSLADKYYKGPLARLNSLRDYLSNPFTLQHLYE